MSAPQHDIKKNTQKETVANPRKRTIIKLTLFGVGAFALGKLFGYLPDIFTDKVEKDIEFKNFSFVETNKSITISEKDGEALLVVDKDGF